MASNHLRSLLVGVTLGFSAALVPACGTPTPDCAGNGSSNECRNGFCCVPNGGCINTLAGL